MVANRRAPGTNLSRDFKKWGSSVLLEGKTALVTGGGRGIGRGITEQFLAAGANVAIIQRRALDDALAEDPRVIHLAADLGDLAQLPAVVEQAVTRFGGLDVLVNNGGVMWERSITDITPDEWDQMANINLRAPIFLVQAALPYLQQHQGSIINIGSIEGEAANPEHVLYCTSKAGVHGMTRALAVDLGEVGVRCNAIAPGWISSELSEKYIDSLSPDGSAREALNSLHPVGRTGTPQDIGDAAVYLASNRSSFVTGQVLVVDGGRTSRLPMPAH